MIIIIFEEQYSRPCNSVTRATIQSELVWVKAKEKSFCVHQILWPCSKCSRFAQRVHFWLFTVTHEMAMFEEQYHTNQSELGHVVLRFWECYMRAFSPTRFCVIALSIRCVAVQWRAKWVHTVKTEAKHRISARQGCTKAHWNTPRYPKPLWHESPVHRLLHTLPFVSIIKVVAEKSGGKVEGH